MLGPEATDGGGLTQVARALLGGRGETGVEEPGEGSGSRWSAMAFEMDDGGSERQ